MILRVVIAACIACAACMLACSVPAAADDAPMQTDVFVAGQEGYHTFRIPAVIRTAEGTLLAFCEGRKDNRRDHGDIDLVIKRSSDDGQSWSPLEVVYEEGGTKNVTLGNPCPVIDAATKTIWLPFCRDNDDVLISKSTDDGATWSKPVEITGDVKPAGWGWYATGPGVGIQLSRGMHEGRLLIPCDHRETIDGESVKLSHVFYSDDGGDTWNLGGSVEKHTDECQAVQLADGRVQINMRNYWGRSGDHPERGGMRAVAHSSDGGESWSELSFDETLVEPVCQASLIAYGTGGGEGPIPLLFSNPASKSTRHRMAVRMSEDEGRTWPVSRVLHEGPSAYSCLVTLTNGEIGCLNEGGEEHTYERIVFARFSEKWLRGESSGN